MCAPTGDCEHYWGMSKAHLGGNSGSNLGVYALTRKCAPQQGLYALTRECPHLISEGTETTGTRENVNQGRLPTHTHNMEEAYHKIE